MGSVSETNGDSRGGGGERYCICKSTETVGRFMIGCDACEDWFHGDCVSVTKSQAKAIKRFYCPPCRAVNPSLQIKYRSTGASTAQPPSPAAAAERRRDAEAKAAAKERKSEGIRPRGCGMCIGCFRSEDCGRCEQCKAIAAAAAAGQATKGLLGCRLRHCVNPPKELPPPPPPKKRKAEPPTEVKKETTAAPRRPGRPKQRKEAEEKELLGPGGTRAKARAYTDFLREAGLLEEPSAGEDGSRHCLGPACTRGARKGSKYCGEECGLALARARLTNVLPRRLAEWRRLPSAADASQSAQLEEIKRRQCGANQALTNLQKEKGLLEAYLVSLAGRPVRKGSGEDAEEGGGGGGSLHCVTCGLEVPARTAIKHLLRCFRKLESQSSYGIPFKCARNPYDIFCQTFTKSSGVYCRRLRVICPEHSKDKRLEAAEGAAICGYWADWRSFHPQRPPPPEAICGAAWKSCNRHYQWERLERALIDQECLGHLFVLDELMEEERSLRMSLAARGNVLALLLHSTTQHKEPPKPPVLSTS